jgi:hypothetical protein
MSRRLRGAASTPIDAAKALVDYEAWLKRQPLAA